jgi:hypothetical protein
MNCFENVYVLFCSFFKYLFLKQKDTFYIVNDIENQKELGILIVSDKDS